MTPPLYETPAPPSSSIQVTFAFFVGTSENRIARLPRYPDSPNMALALHAARRPTLLFEFLDYPHQSLNFLFLESFVVQPQLRIGGSIGIQRDQSKAYLPLSTSKCHTRSAPLHLGRDSSGALYPLRISRLSPSVTEFLISGILRGSTPTQDWWEYWDTERSEQSVSSPFNV